MFIKLKIEVKVYCNKHIGESSSLFPTNMLRLISFKKEKSR